MVATPIGNLEDFSPRAQRVLAAVDLVAAEDTRHSAKLLAHFGIQAQLLPLHDHNESAQLATLLARLQDGADVALISDAGTPLISDPGYRLVAAAAAAGIEVASVPGPSALTAALSVAGLPTDRFVFEGFLAGRPVARRQQLEQFRDETRTVVCYETPHRVLAALQDVVEVLGSSRQLVLCRELSKRFETVYRGSAPEVLAQLQQAPDQVRGEMVLLLRGVETTADSGTDREAARIMALLAAELPMKQAAALAARITGRRKNELYQRALQEKSEQAEN